MTYLKFAAGIHVLIQLREMPVGVCMQKGIGKIKICKSSKLLHRTCPGLTFDIVRACVRAAKHLICEMLMRC